MARPTVSPMSAAPRSAAIRRPPRVSTSRSWRVPVADPLEQRRDLSSSAAAVDGQLDRGRRALEPVEVLAERERAARVEADHLEHPVAAVEAVVGQRDRRLGVGVITPSIDASSAIATPARL